MQTAPPPTPTETSGSKSGTKTSSKAVEPVRRRPPEEEPTEYWSYDLFGCLSDWKLCCATFLCPCYTVGRNAEYFGDEGPLTGLLYCLGLGVCIQCHHRHVDLPINCTVAALHQCAPGQMTWLEEPPPWLRPGYCFASVIV